MQQLLALLFFIAFGPLWATEPSVCNVVFGNFETPLPYKVVVRPSTRLISALSQNKGLVKEAREASRMEGVQEAWDQLLKVELYGTERNPNRLSLGNGYFELRNIGSGARVYIKRFPNKDGGSDIFIVGKSSKKNQETVFSLMRKTFPDFPAPPPGMRQHRK